MNVGISGYTIKLFLFYTQFQSVAEQCRQFPEHAEQLFQVYLDLSEAKDFEELEVLPAPSLGRCLIRGRHPDNVGEKKMRDLFLKLGAPTTHEHMHTLGQPLFGPAL